MIDNCSMEDNLYDDLDFPDLFNTVPAFPIITQAEEELIRVLPSELKAINARIERLERALSTQSLRLEIERAKRQKLRLAVKPSRYETPAFHPDALRQSIETNFVHQNAVNYQMQGDIDKLNTLTFRCFSRMQQLLTFVLSSIPITSSDHPDTTSLLEEIGRTIQQLCIFRSTTTSV